MNNYEKILKNCPILQSQETFAGLGTVEIENPVTIFTLPNYIQTSDFLLSSLLDDYNFKATVSAFNTESFDNKGIYFLSPAGIELVKSQFKSLAIPDFTDKMTDEGYILIAGQKKIIIIAQTPAGMFYGVQTLLSLIEIKADTLSVNEIILRDWPDMRLRGFSDDISRGQVSNLDHFKRIIRFLARYKMNVYMPYLEDMFQFKSYPTLGAGRGALSTQECIELQEYAALYHIEIIPVFQTLGHYECLLIQPEYMPLADFPGASSLNTVSEDTYTFLDKLLAEIVPVFRSVYFHIGADESYDVGSGASRKMAQEKGVAAVHAAHYKRVFKILKKYHKQIIMYGDIILEFPDILKELPQDIIIMDWHYDIQDEYISTQKFRDSGHSFIVSPGNQNWSRIFPDLERARQNIYRIIRDGRNNGAIGAITSSWGDFGSANLRELNYYQIAFTAQCAWNGKPVELGRFETAFFKNFYGNDDPGYAELYRRLSQACEYYDLNYFYSQPFYPLSRPVAEIANRNQKLLALYNYALDELSRLRKITTRNKEHLDILELSARQYRWTALLNKIQVTLHTADKKECPALLQELDTLAQELQALAEAFYALWSKYNRPANLEHIKALFKRTCAWLKVKSDEIIAGNYQLNGRLQSPFITCPVMSTNNVPELYIRKNFSLSDISQPVWLQLIADSFATIWINGQEIGHVVATRTLSALVEAERIKFWNIAEYLVKGENLLAIKVLNYKPTGIAAVHITLESDDKQLQLGGNDLWQCTCGEEHNWHMPGFNDKHWKNNIPAANSWIISRPEFHYGLSSRVEFYRTPIY